MVDMRWIQVDVSECSHRMVPLFGGSRSRGYIASFGNPQVSRDPSFSENPHIPITARGSCSSNLLQNASCNYSGLYLAVGFDLVLDGLGKWDCLFLLTVVLSVYMVEASTKHHGACELQPRPWMARRYKALSGISVQKPNLGPYQKSKAVVKDVGP